MVLAVDNNQDALLDFGEFKAFARLPSAVFKGDQVLIKVLKGGRNPVLQLQQGKTAEKGGNTPISEFEVVSKKTLSGMNRLQLNPGDLVTGRITGFSRHGQHLVDLGPIKTFATITFPVKTGQILPLRVVDNAAGLRLEIDGGAGKTGRNVQNPLSGFPVIEPEEMKNTLDAVKAVLEKLSSAPDNSKNLLQLQTAFKRIEQFFSPLILDQAVDCILSAIRLSIRDSGLYFEKKLEQILEGLFEEGKATRPADLLNNSHICAIAAKDLKPNLLVLQKVFEDREALQLFVDKKTLLALKATISKLVSGMEQQQAQTILHKDKPELFQVFSHLLQIPDANRQAKLKVYYPKKKKDGKQHNPMVSILLDMKKLGEIRTDLWMNHRDLKITFYVGKEKVRTLIEKQKEQIETKLKDDFVTILINVVINQHMIEQFEMDDLNAIDGKMINLMA